MTRTWKAFSFWPYGEDKYKCWAIKNGNNTFTLAAQEFLDALEPGLWAPDTVVCVIPSSGHGKGATPPIVSDTPMEDIANSMVEKGLVAKRIELLERRTPKSKIQKGACYPP